MFPAEAAQLFHYRIRAGREVNVLLENGVRWSVGVEVKAMVTSKGFKGMHAVAEALGDRFRATWCFT